MKSVELKNGAFAIPVNIKVYLHKDRMIKIVTDLIHKEFINFESSKSEIIKNVRSHLYSQGVSVYDDWYEDTDETPVINELYERVEPWISELFPEIS